MKADETIRQLRAENQQCVNQLLSAKTREAEQLNMARDLYDSLLRRMRKEVCCGYTGLKAQMPTPAHPRVHCRFTGRRQGDSRGRS